MTALKSKTKNLTKLKIRRKLQKINLPKEIRYIEANTVFIFYGNQLTVYLKLVNYITLFKTSKILTFFCFFLPFDSELVDIPCIVSGIGSILLFYPFTYTLDLFAATLHVHKCTKAQLDFDPQLLSFEPGSATPNHVFDAYTVELMQICYQRFVALEGG
jgi:hypothetical protein